MSSGTATAGLTFMSWYRTGLSAAVAAPAGGGAPLDAAPPVAVVVPVSATISDPDNPGDTTPGDSETGSVQVRLHAPGDVTGLDPAQIIRTYPTAGAVNVEPDAFPLIEFARPDIPWMLSPTGPQTNLPTDSDPRRGLRPWLCLIAVRQPPASLAPAAQAGGLAQLTVPASELPDPTHLWLWAHAQVTTLSSDTLTIPELISQEPQRALSRLLSPRYLEPNTAYLACVVPTFAAVESSSGAQTLSPAWQLTDPSASVTLPVYYSWSFTTGPAGDFRTLVLQLQHWDQGGVGVRPLDIGNAGTGMPAPAAGQPPWLISLEGALVSADVASSIGAWSNSTVEAAIQQALVTSLDGTAGELTPPVYGSTQVAFKGQLASGQGPDWLRTLNLDPRYRAAASLGAALVRANQDALILSAWDQSGQASAANLVLRQGQLARELGSSTYSRRIGASGSTSPPMDDDRLLQITSGVQSQVQAPPTGSGGIPSTVADALAANEALAAVTSVPFRRLAQPTGPLATRLAGAPLPAPVTNLAKPGGIAPIPPLTAVSGLVDLTSVSANAAAPETLRGLTAARVSTIQFPWEQAVASASLPAGATSTDLLLQPGYLADLWVLGSGIGGALDWDGQALVGWTEDPSIPVDAQLTPGPAVNPGGAPTDYYFPGSVGGGAASVITWDLAGTSANPAVAVVTASVDTVQETLDNGVPANFYGVTVACTLIGDFIGGVQDSPVQQVNTEWNELVWPSVGVMNFQWPLAQGPFPPMTVGVSVTTDDLTGTGKPSVAVVWSVSSGPQAGTYAKILLDVGVDSSSAQTISSTLTGTSNVQSAVLANGRLFVLAGGGLQSAPVDAAAGTIGSFTTNTAWRQTQPEGWEWVDITAADFSGSGRADLLFFYSVASPEPLGTAPFRAAYRIGYEPDANGEPTYWSDEVEAPVPVSDIQTSVLLGPLDAQTSVLRQETAQAFRSAAAATQARLTTVVPAQASPPPPPSVDTSPLAGAVRTAIDPAVTVPASVGQRLVLPAPLPSTGSDQLQPIAFAPQFPQPFYETVTESAVSRLVPGISAFPDEAITVLGTDPNTIESILIGANHEFSRELLWHAVPALLTGTFFARFWDQLDASGNPLPDITDIAGWTTGSALGTHAANATSGDDAVLLIRGELVRRFPHATIYAAPAVTTSSGSRTVDLTQRIDPLFSGTLGGDSIFIGFPFTVQSAMSAPGSPGKYFVFQEHPMAPRFGLNLDIGTPSSFGQPPADWRDLSWSETVEDQASFEALTYLDASSASPLWGVSLTDTAGASTPTHRWGFSPAHMAHICFRPPVLIAIHADELLAPASGGSPG